MNFNQIQVGGPSDCPAVTTTSSNNEYNFSIPQEYGWVCQKCGRVYSPSTAMCSFCGGNSNVMPYTVSDKTFLDDWFIHHITGPLKEPEINLDPEWFINYSKPVWTYNYNRKEEF